MTDALARRIELHTARMRAMFYPKSDLPAGDAQLRALRDIPAAAVLAAAGPVAGGPWTPLPAQGTFHALFGNGQGEVLKLNKCPSLLENWQLHADALVARALAAAGLRCVPVLSVDCSRTALATDAERLGQAPGQPLAAYDHDDALMLPRLAIMARYLRAVHAITGQGFGFLDIRSQALSGAGAGAGAGPLRGVHRHWADYLVQQLDAHLAIVARPADATPAECAQMAALLREAWPEPAQPSLLHGDCGSHNIFMDGDAAVAIDWEDALLGDPLFDLAFWASFHPQRRWAVMFEAYFGRPWTPERTFWRYYLRVALSKSVHRRRFGYADVAGRPRASLRMQQALTALHPTGAAA